MHTRSGMSDASKFKHCLQSIHTTLCQFRVERLTFGTDLGCSLLISLVNKNTVYEQLHRAQKYCQCKSFEYFMFYPSVLTLDHFSLLAYFYFLLIWLNYF